MPARLPFLSVILAVLIPLPPRPLVGYSVAEVPLTVTFFRDNQDFLVFSNSCCTNDLVTVTKGYPLTPAAIRLILRIVSSLKRTL